MQVERKTRQQVKESLEHSFKLGRRPDPITGGCPDCYGGSPPIFPPGSGGGGWGGGNNDRYRLPWDEGGGEGDGFHRHILIGCAFVFIVLVSCLMTILDMKKESDERLAYSKTASSH